ncbi:MAG: hypothetical protein IPK16_01690 [Anaerolineales bacterium]|nr:hypothetical protein [Anaerolineales bacterium]
MRSAPDQGKLAETSTNEQLVVDLPAIYIDYDEQGNASISGAAISQLGALLGTDLSALDRTPEQIKQLQDAGVQNILANITPAGLSVYANGQSLLSIAWTPETLANMGDFLGNMDDPSAKQIKDLVPVLSNMSVGIVMRIPTAEGAEELPLIADAPDAKQLMADAKAAAPAALTALLPDNLKNMSALLGGLLAGLPPLKVTFDAAGAGTLEGLAPFILSQIPAGAISLPADQLDSIKKLGIQSLTIKNSADGLNLSINGKEMPTILWNRGEFANLATLGIEGGVLKALANLDDGTLETLQQVADAAPILQTAKLDVTINLPQ